MASRLPVGHTSKYRPDVDGLRAIAVAAVVGFHAMPLLFPGGFVGVDIFFVISGFLITGVIAGDLAAGNFTIRRFYARRIRRIFPALAVVLAVVLLLGWAWLLPDEWQQFGKHVFAGAAFVSNLAFAREGGYFAWSAEFKPLLHLWSLGVEEQFYFVWPLFIALLWKTSRRVRLSMLVMAIVTSFALNVATVKPYPAYTFYLPFTRLWELGLGSLLALWRPATDSMPRRAAELASWSGFVLLITSIVVVGEDGFPGVWALLPTLGTLLVIAAGPAATLNQRLLSTRTFVFVGLISYPLYLWHWPLFSLTRIGRGGGIGPVAILVIVTSAVLLAWATYRWVETPVRAKSAPPQRLYALTALLVVVAAIGAAAGVRRIHPRLSNDDISQYVSAATDWSYPFGGNFGRTDGFTVSTVKGTEARAILFVGDSHMEQYWPRIQFVHARQGSPELRFATNGGCAPLPHLGGRRGDVCQNFLAFALDAARDPRVTTIVFGGSWPAYLGDPSNEQGLRALREFGSEIEALERGGKRVYVVLASPAGDELNPRSMISRYDGHVESTPLPLRDFLRRASPAIEAVRATARHAGATVIDPLPALCPDGQCPSATSDGRPMYKDASHMRPFYVREHAVFLDAVLR